MEEIEDVVDVEYVDGAADERPGSAGRGGRGGRGGRREVGALDRVKGATQMAVGTAVAAIGVPMLVLPGPGAVAVVGGAALASKGQRTFSGRDATRVERALDDLSAKAGRAAADQAGRAVKAAPGVALGLVVAGGKAAIAGGRLAISGGRAAARLFDGRRAGGAAEAGSSAAADASAADNEDKE